MAHCKKYYTEGQGQAQPGTGSSPPLLTPIPKVAEKKPAEAPNAWYYTNTHKKKKRRIFDSSVYGGGVHR
jgi:hypothetical protein